MTSKRTRLIISMFLCATLLFGAMGCGARPTVTVDSSVAFTDDRTTTQDSTTTANTTVSVTESVAEESAATESTVVPVAESTTTVSTTVTTAALTTTVRTTKSETTAHSMSPSSMTTVSATVSASSSASTAPSSATTTTTTTTRATTTLATPTTTAVASPPAQEKKATTWEQPQVIRQTGTEYGRYDRVIRTDDGRIVAVGVVKTLLEDNTDSVIDVYNEELVLQDSYRFTYSHGYRFIACEDSGFLMDCGDHLQKFSAQVEPEWSLYLIKSTEHGSVTAMAQLSDGTFAVVYRMYRSEEKRIDSWFLMLLTEEGQVLFQTDLKIRDNGFDVPALIPDDEGGFHLVMSVSPEDNDAPAALYQALDPEKGRDVVVARYVPNAAKDASWRIDSVLTVGSGDDEWCEEAVMDAQGNFYIALGHRGETTDPFWSEMAYGTHFRRMLVKVTPKGEVVYRVPLSGHGMAVDQVSGIHLRDGQVCVTGISTMYDGVLDPYVATEQTLQERFAMYAVTVDEDGTLLSRRAFKYDQLELGMPDGSVWMSDGRLLIGGAVCSLSNDFDLDFPEGTHSNRALFVYQ